MSAYPTPASLYWWLSVLAAIARSFTEPRHVTAAEVLAEVDDRDARFRAALRDLP